jgi:hypothetical protein
MKTANENVIRTLAKALVDAKAGDIEAVVVITASPMGKPDAVFAGEEELMPSINIAIDAAKISIVTRLTQIMMQPVSPILRPASDGRTDN